MKLLSELKDNSFKKKPFYFELFNFSFKHKPLDKHDSQFIGRTKIVDRLRGFISDSSCKSGAYLITGFRGMGKTSVVNKALEIYEPKSSLRSYFTLLLISIIGLISFDFFRVLDLHLIHSISIFGSCGIFIFLSLCYIIYCHPNSKNTNNLFMGIFINRNLLVDALFRNPFLKSRYVFPRLIRSVFIGLIFFVSNFMVLLLVEADNSFLKFYSTLIFSLVVFLFHDRIKWDRKLNNFYVPGMFMLFLNISYLFFVYLSGLSILSFFLGLVLIGCYVIFKFISAIFRRKSSRAYSGMLNVFRSFFSLRKFLFVRINLGKDVIDEKDVLKYTTNNLLVEYIKWRKNIFHLGTFFHRVFPVIFMFCMLSILSNHSSFRDFNSSLIKDSSISYLFPSQVVYINSEVLYNYAAISSLDSYLDEMNSKYSAGYTAVKFTRYKFKNIAMVFNIVDYYLSTIYRNVRFVFIGDTKINFLNVLFPPNIDYLIILILLISLVLIRTFNIFNYFGLSTHKKALSDLRGLKNKIDASIAMDKSVNFPSSKISSYNLPTFSFNKKMTYYPLDAKDIESELVHILEEISSIPPLFYSVEPIVIFDELDKITSHHNLNISAKKNESLQTDMQIKRQEIITGILSSLKNFLSSSKAKFIFIAGRDMYDAAMAGVSDRQSILDSIFHDNKIYVNSFFTESVKMSVDDIKSVTERFLCTYLVPKSFCLSCKEEDVDLKLFYKYLVSIEKHPKELFRAINVIRNLITYITYRSNGAPKKISNIFEQFVSPMSRKAFENESVIIYGRNSDALYLKLSYYSQYKVSFIALLVNPLFYKLSTYRHEFGDKLLVSLSYLMDHIYKYHRFGFSTRNLSLTPEIIDINKEPEFRKVLHELISDLSVSQLRRIVSGLHDYRFESRLKTELMFLTKISAIDSAAFNFTLDESLEIKRFFYNRLAKLKQTYYENGSFTISRDYVNSIAFFHMTLGDLHFYDQEYTDAIINYLEALQTINSISVNEIDEYLMGLLLRNNLKLGSAFEKEGMVKSALSKYSFLSQLVLRDREFNLDDFDLKRFVIPKKDYLLWKDRVSAEVDLTEKEIKDKFDNAVFGYLSVIGKTAKEMEERSTIENIVDFDGDKLAENIEKLPFISNSVFLHSKLLTIENSRLLYQPIVARLHLIEKASPNQLRPINIERAIKEFEFLSRTFRSVSKNVIISEFYNKIGDLLYYKGTTSDNVEFYYVFYYAKSVSQYIDDVPIVSLFNEKKFETTTFVNLCGKVVKYFLDPSFKNVI